MKFRTIFYIFTAGLFAVCLGMHFWNSYNGWGIATAKTLHPEVLAQLNDDDGGTTGGGTTGGNGTGTGIGTGTDTGGPGDVNKIPGAYLIEENETKRYKTDESGTIHIPDLEYPYTGLKGNSYYNVTIHYGRCGLSMNLDSYCDIREAKTYIIGIILDQESEGDGTGTGSGNNPLPPTP